MSDLEYWIIFAGWMPVVAFTAIGLWLVFLRALQNNVGP